MTFTESEERMMNEDVKMQNLKAFDGAAKAEAGQANGIEHPSSTGPGGIVVSNSVDVVTEDRRSSHNSSEPQPQPVHESW